ncbi:MAG: anaerobic C4-dicarboxylate transporter, partial [Plesiomonas sp.]
ILAAKQGVGEAISMLTLLAISIPASLCGVLVAALWSLRRGKDLDDDPEFQARLKDPKQREYIYGGSSTLLNESFPKESYWATAIFFAAIGVVVLLGAFDQLRPVFDLGDGKTKMLSMNIAIQMMMLIAGALILMLCKVKPGEIANSAVFKAGMVAIFSVFGVAWMSDTFFQAHMVLLKESLADVVVAHPWTYALVLFLVSKLVNSQAAALTAIAPMGLALGVDPKMIVAFFPACYGYFVLPTYPSDLACIGFDRSGTTRIGKFIINHSFILPGLIGVSTASAVGFLLVETFL